MAATSHKGRTEDKAGGGIHSMFPWRRGQLSTVMGGRAGAAGGKGTVGGKRGKGRGQGHRRACF